MIGRPCLSWRIEGIEILVARLSAAFDCGEADNLLPLNERARAARLRFPADRRRFVAAHLLLRQLLSARSGIPARALRLTTGPHGKPAMEGNGALQFSLSRSGGFAAYAFVRGRAVGVDIEQIRPFGESAAIVAQTFALCERQAYAALSPSAKIAGFFRGWTRTEALAKALGGGLTMSSEALDAALEAGWTVHDFDFSLAPGMVGAVACSRAGVTP